jgi:hypothetical protein
MSAEHLAGPYRAPVKPPPPAGERRARRVIELELEEGERLLWAGQPPQGVRFSLLDIFLIPFSLVWGGFAIAWEVLAIVSGAPFFFALFGVPFVVVGLHLMVGRFFTDARARARTFYGVTDRRAIIVTNTPERRVQALDLEGLEAITLREESKGSGSIEFGRPMLTPAPGGGWKASIPGKEPLPSFEKIADAHAVYQILKDAQVDLRERRRKAEEPLRVETAIVNEEEEEYNDEESRLDRVPRA